MTRRKLSITFLTLCVLCGVATSGLYLLLRSFNDLGEAKLRSEVETHWKAHLTQVLDDYELVGKQPLFQPLSLDPQRDASTLLNETVQWEGASSSKAVQTWNKTHEKKNGVFAIDPLRSFLNKRKLKDLGKNELVAFADQLNFEKWDLSWATKLGDYDHWRVDVHSPMREDLESSSGSGLLMQSPIPNYSGLQNAAKILLLKGVQERAFDKRAAQLRQLARLVLSNSNLVSQMVAASIFKFEIEMREALNNSSRPASHYGARENASITIKDVEALRRMVWVSVESLNTRSPREIRATLLRSPAAQVSICAALSERADGYKFVLQHGSPQDKSEVEDILSMAAPLLKNCRELPWIARLYNPYDRIVTDTNDWDLSGHERTSLKGFFLRLALRTSERERIRYFLQVATPIYFGIYERHAKAL